LAREVVGIVVSIYPPREMNDPATFLEYAVHALVGLPASAVVAMAHPQHGITRESKFLPSIAEMVQWCEKRVSTVREAQRKADARLLVWQERHNTELLLRGPRPSAEGRLAAEMTFAKREALVARELAKWPQPEKAKFVPAVERPFTEEELASGARLAAKFGGDR
jgi:hypothetical protein